MHVIGKFNKIVCNRDWQETIYLQVTQETVLLLRSTLNPILQKTNNTHDYELTRQVNSTQIQIHGQRNINIQMNNLCNDALYEEWPSEEPEEEEVSSDLA